MIQEKVIILTECAPAFKDHCQTLGPTSILRDLAYNNYKFESHGTITPFFDDKTFIALSFLYIHTPTSLKYFLIQETGKLGYFSISMMTKKSLIPSSLYIGNMQQTHDQKTHNRVLISNRAFHQKTCICWSRKLGSLWSLTLNF